MGQNDAMLGPSPVDRKRIEKALGEGVEYTHQVEGSGAEIKMRIGARYEGFSREFLVKGKRHPGRYWEMIAEAAEAGA